MSFTTSPRLSASLIVAGSTVAFVTPAAAQSREQRQMMADIRMLQEQSQQLQNLLGSIAEALKAVNAVEARSTSRPSNTGKALRRSEAGHRQPERTTSA